MTLTEIVKGKAVRFKFHKPGDLWYETQDGSEFPVPIRDTGSDIFKAEDKVVGYMGLSNWRFFNKNQCDLFFS